MLSSSSSLAALIASAFRLNCLSVGRSVLYRGIDVKYDDDCSFEIVMNVTATMFDAGDQDKILRSSASD